MKDISELFWRASFEEIKQGYKYDCSTEEYVCLICGKSFVQGVVYPQDNNFYEAEKMIKVHITKEHSSMFKYLLEMNRKYTGLTDHQKNTVDLLL